MKKLFFLAVVFLLVFPVLTQDKNQKNSFVMNITAAPSISCASLILILALFPPYNEYMNWQQFPWEINAGISLGYCWGNWGLGIKGRLLTAFGDLDSYVFGEIELRIVNFWLNFGLQTLLHPGLVPPGMQPLLSDFPYVFEIGWRSPIFPGKQNNWFLTLFLLGMHTKLIYFSENNFNFEKAAMVSLFRFLKFGVGFNWECTFGGHE